MAQQAREDAFRRRRSPQSIPSELLIFPWAGGDYDDHRRHEKKRDRLAVIAAGYTNEMDKFFKSNPGLASRFGMRIEFEDYGPAELLEIFRRLRAKEGYRLSLAADRKLEGIVKQLYDKRGKEYCNARDIRNLFEKSIMRLAGRLSGKREVADNDPVMLTYKHIPD
jgi:hypothetical protein